MKLETLDFANFEAFDAGEIRRMSGLLDAAFKSSGFLVARNLGFQTSLVDNLFACSKSLFALPSEKKWQYNFSGPQSNFGYQAAESEALAPDGLPDLKEAFTMRNVLGRVDDEDVWPSDEFRDISTALFRSCFAAATELLKVCAVAIGQKENFFSDTHSGENATLRILHYPSINPRLGLGQMGAGAHSDYGSITFLFQQGVGGLQILDSNKTWRDCPAVEDAAIVNVGDMLEIWSNGLFPSTRHRVLPRTNGTDRYSIAFFMDPDDQVVVEPVTTCIENNRISRFAPVQVGTYLKRKIADSQVHK